MMLQAMGEEQPAIQLSAEDEAFFDESLVQETHGDFATDEQVRAIWTKYNL